MLQRCAESPRTDSCQGIAGFKGLRLTACHRPGRGEGLGHIEGHLGPSYVGAMLGSYWAILGLGSCWAMVGPCWVMWSACWAMWRRCWSQVGAVLGDVGACGSHVEAMLGHLGPKMGYRRVSCTYNGPFWGHVQHHKTLCKIRAFLLKPASMPRWPILRLVEASLCHVGLGSGLVGASRTMLGACSGLVAGHNGQNPCKTAFLSQHSWKPREFMVKLWASTWAMLRPC